MNKPRDLVGRGLRKEQREGCRGLAPRQGMWSACEGSPESGAGGPGEALSFLFPDLTSRLAALSLFTAPAMPSG